MTDAVTNRRLAAKTVGSWRGFPAGREPAGDVSVPRIVKGVTSSSAMPTSRRTSIA